MLSGGLADRAITFGLGTQLPCSFSCDGWATSRTSGAVLLAEFEATFANATVEPKKDTQSTLTFQNMHDIYFSLRPRRLEKNGRWQGKRS